MCVPLASSCPRADPRESRAPRHCGLHPQKPRWSPGRRRREGLPRHHYAEVSKCHREVITHVENAPGASSCFETPLHADLGMSAEAGCLQHHGRRM